MKTIKETFVIVKQFEGQFDFFQNYISFDKAEIDLKCEELNKKANDDFEKNSKKNKLPLIPLVIFMVLNLEEAINKFRDNVKDHYIEHDASY
jgi:hypothetical protein